MKPILIKVKKIEVKKRKRTSNHDAGPFLDLAHSIMTPTGVKAAACDHDAESNFYGKHGQSYDDVIKKGPVGIVKSHSKKG